MSKIGDASVTWPAEAGSDVFISGEMSECSPMFALAMSRRNAEFGGAYRDRTDDLKLAKLALSQLS